MRARYAAMGIVLSLSIAAGGRETTSFALRPDLSRDVLESGYAFLGNETQSLQQDEFANPGLLWVDQGSQLFSDAAGNASCESCHAQSGQRSLVGAATRHPAFDTRTQTLLNLEARINACRERYQGLRPLPYEAEPLLALTAYVAHLSRGRPYEVSIDGAAAPYFARGRDYFFQRRGQLNLACSQCHDDNWGRMLRGDRLSQGHPNAYPGYRLEWQSFGSLHRRIRDCDAGVRAEPHALGSQIYTSLELYLVWRAGNLAIESPGVRR